MTGPFSRTTLWVIVPVAAVSLLVAIGLTLFGDDFGSKPSAGADAYSRSALGHRALVDLLARLDVPVVVSRSESGYKARDGVLVIAEPVITSGSPAAHKLRDEIAAAPRSLVVLPKWYGMADRDQRWIDEADLVPAAEIDPVLEALGITATITRTFASPGWRSHDFAAPVIREPQTVTGEGITPIVESDDGILLGSAMVDGSLVYILADPDVLNNFGLREPANARLAVGVIEQLRHGGPVVFDETTHGFAATPSLARALFRFPLALATLQFLICAVLIVWAAMVRFGPLRAAPPPIAPGKDFLIRNTASLLAFGGHHAHALRRYLASSIQAVRHALHAPSELPAAATAAWLERVRAARGGKISLPELTSAVDELPNRAPPHKIVELADLIYRWRQEMTHGPDHRS